MRSLPAVVREVADGLDRLQAGERPAYAENRSRRWQFDSARQRRRRAPAEAVEAD